MNTLRYDVIEQGKSFLGPYIVLNTTPFQPSTEDVPPDRGQIILNEKKYNVTTVIQENSGRIYHFLETKNPLPSEILDVHVKIDFEFAFRKAKYHTFALLLTHFVCEEYGIMDVKIENHNAHMIYFPSISIPLKKLENFLNNKMQELAKQNLSIQAEEGFIHIKDITIFKNGPAVNNTGHFSDILITSIQSINGETRIFFAF
ncbi:MAG: hypothetical protein WDZ28_01335 [Simkaniaceae bacterium]